ncbi:hypothetical protein [Streptomyces sp. SID3343]|uniref:hypothetical protein n=1 Tax=Streptomyces sp. SID3343 TaxID=2690260 RepID=UPI0013712976|nr:hypothetical protein [Streptomyces sp. SID3343]MYW03497.1 hypothetical protein [Streptomyces sp. SID3343]
MGAIDVDDSALSRLLSENIGKGLRVSSQRAFVERAIDPDSKYQVPAGLVAKIMNRTGRVHPTPALISAIAAGLDLPRAVVEAAALRQYIGIEVSRVAGQDVYHAPGMTVEDMPLTQAVIERETDVTDVTNESNDE